jgi:integrase
MNTQHLQENYPKLLEHMREDGYGVGYIKSIEREILFILSVAADKDWESYSDVYRDYVNASLCKNTLRSKLTCLSVIEGFVQYGRYPDGHRQQRFKTLRLYPLLSAEFKGIIDCYRKFENQRGRKLATTIEGEASQATGFFHCLQQSGINAIDKITQSSVLSVFVDGKGEIIRSHTYKNATATVLNACIAAGSESSESLAKVAAFLPELRKNRKNIQYLTHDEISKIKRILTNTNSGISLRNKAVGILLLYTGLRRSDIAGLKIGDIDWEREVIFICQQKTNVPKQLPIRAIVGNALYDYITLERPATENEYVFISQNRPYERFTNRGIGSIADVIMKAANVRQNTGDRKGMHVFRHHVATALMENGVARLMSLSNRSTRTEPFSSLRRMMGSILHSGCQIIFINCG